MTAGRYYDEQNPDAPENLEDYETRVRHAIARMWRDPQYNTDPRLKSHVAGMFHCLEILTGRPASQLRVFFRVDTFGAEMPPLADALERMVTKLCDPSLSLKDKKMLTKAMAAEWAELRDLDDSQVGPEEVRIVSVEEMAEALTEAQP